MTIPAALRHNRRGPQGQLLAWDREAAVAAIRAAEPATTADGALRRLMEAGLPVEPQPPAALRDEQGHAPIALIREHIEQVARRRRLRQVFVECPAQVDGLTLLVATTRRTGTRWLVIDAPGDDGRTADQPSAATLAPPGLRDALAALVGGRASVIWPSGPVTLAFRQLVAAAGGPEFELADRTPVMVATFAFPERRAATPPRAPSASMRAGDGLSQLDRLEAESIHIMREVVAQAGNPVMMYSIGKDSSVMLHLARKAFHPSVPPFPLLHVDTRWKFQAMYEFRDRMARESGMDLIVHINPDGVARDINPFDHGSALHTDVMKTEGLKQALDAHRFDVAFGGARRDEEKSRAKERVFSFRTRAHRWDPKNQRPELWRLYNGYKNEGESIRAFPLSNWTELDIWQYIHREAIPIVPLYFAAVRPVVARDGMLLMVDDDRMRMLPGESIELRRVRFRTLGCYPLSGAIESDADDLESIILELLQSRTSERQGRAIDTDSSGSMERKKQEGYF